MASWTSWPARRRPRCGASVLDVALCLDSSALGQQSVAGGFPVNEMVIMLTDLCLLYTSDAADDYSV